MKPRALLVVWLALVSCATEPTVDVAPPPVVEAPAPIETPAVAPLVDDRLPAPETATDHVPAPWPFDVRNYTLDVSIDAADHGIDGVVTIDVDETADGLTELPLDAVDLKIAKVVEVVRDADSGDMDQRERPFTYDGRTLRIPLSEPHRSGTQRRFRIDYSGNPRRGLYFNDDRPRQVYTQGEAEESRYWFPCHDAPDDRATHSIQINLPRTWAAVGAGKGDARPGGRWDEGRRTTWWRIATPHVSYLTTMAMGEYDVVEDAGVVPLTYLVEQRDAPFAKHDFRKTNDILKFFGDYTGLPYPYPKYSQTCVRNFMFGGMENISATTLTDHTIHPPEWEPARTSTSLIAHEAAHQWFGDWITCADWSHCWLNEGFATYFDLLFTEHDEGRDEFLWRLRGERHGALGAMDHERRPVIWNKYATPMDLFNGHAYPGGAVRLHMLRHLLGDKTFRGAIQHYVKTCGLQCVTTDDFQKAVSDYSGQDLAWFFDQWFRKPGYPVLKIRWKWDEAKKAEVVTVEQTQKAEGGVPEAYRLSLDVAFDPHHLPLTQRRIEITKRSETFEFPMPSAPECVRVDPDTALLARFDVERPVADWIDELSGNANPDWRMVAAETLQHIYKDDKRDTGDRAHAHMAIGTALRKESFAPLRAALAKPFVQFTDDATAEELVDVMNADSDLRVRLAAADALHGFPGNAKAVAAMTSLLADSNDLLRASAVTGIVKLKAPNTFETLLDHVERPGFQSVVRVAALRGFGDLGDERAFPTLVRFAKSEDNWSRGPALDSLGRMGKKKPAYRDAMLPYLDDPERGVRHAAADALAKIGDPETMETLVAHFKTETWPACRDALRNAVKACRAAAVEEGRLVSVESARGAELRDRHAALRDESAALAESLKTLAGDEKTQAETRLASLKDQMGQLERDLGAIGVPVKPAPKKEPSATK